LGELKGVVLFENDKTDLRQNFLQRLGKKHLFITTCIEKQCIRPLRHYSLGIFKTYCFRLYQKLILPKSGRLLILCANCALRIKAYFSGLRNLRCTFTKQFTFSQFVL